MSDFNFNRIKELLAKKGKQSTELAAYANITTRAVSTWCTNRNQPPVDMLFKIADFLGVEAGELLTLKKDLMPVSARKKVPVRKAAPQKTSAGRAARRSYRQAGNN